MVAQPRRGRPASSSDREKRLKHVRVAECYVILAWPDWEVAQVFGCSPSTVREWSRLAIGYPEGSHVASHLDALSRRAS